MYTEDPKQRVFLITIGVALMVSFVFVVGESLHEGNREATLPETGLGATPSLPLESGVFDETEKARGYLTASTERNFRRSLRTYYSRRAYPGAPPVIPHELGDEDSYGGRTCLQCHANGGFAPNFNAYTPVVPHPEWESCRQCHVPSESLGRFRGTNWTRPQPPALPGGALPGGPPAIAHEIGGREDCLSCHAGPAAVPDIRVQHPERINCRQCHVASNATTTWTRAEGDGTP